MTQWPDQLLTFHYNAICTYNCNLVLIREKYLLILIKIKHSQHRGNMPDRGPNRVPPSTDPDSSRDKSF